MGGYSLRVSLREDTAAALAKCRPLPALSRLEPYLAPQQLKDVYDKFTSVDEMEFKSVEERQTENGIFQIEETSFLESLEEDFDMDITFKLLTEPQPTADRLRGLSHDKASQTEMSFERNAKRRGWRKLFSQRSLRRRPSKKTIVHQPSLEIKTKFNPPVTPTECSGRWIPSAQHDWGSNLPSSPSLTSDAPQNIKSFTSNFSPEPLHSRSHHNGREVFRFGLLFRM